MLIFTLCQPIVDIKIICDSYFLHRKYNLEVGGYTKLHSGEERIQDAIHNESEDMRPSRDTLGGTSLNTLLLMSKNSTHDLVYLGAIGNDRFGGFVRKTIEKTRIKSHLEVIEGGRTAECIVLINGQNRSLVTSLGASEMISKRFVMERERISLLKKAGVFYITAFMLCSCPNVVKALVEFLTNNQYFCFNLGASSIYDPEGRKGIVSHIKDIYGKINCIIGNADEFAAFYEAMFGGEGKDIGTKEILKKLAVGGKAVVCTNADKPTYYSVGSMFGKISVERIPRSEKTVIDTCGAGDAFAAGFISKYGENPKGHLVEYIGKGHEWARNYIVENSRLLSENPRI
jgi:adenosine kinase